MAKCGPTVVWFLSVIKGPTGTQLCRAWLHTTVRSVLCCYGQFSKFKRNHTDRHITYK